MKNKSTWHHFSIDQEDTIQSVGHLQVLLYNANMYHQHRSDAFVRKNNGMQQEKKCEGAHLDQVLVICKKEEEEEEGWDEVPVVVVVPMEGCEFHDVRIVGGSRGERTEDSRSSCITSRFHSIGELASNRLSG